MLPTFEYICTSFFFSLNYVQKSFVIVHSESNNNDGNGVESNNIHIYSIRVCIPVIFLLFTIGLPLVKFFPFALCNNVKKTPQNKTIP